MNFYIYNDNICTRVKLFGEDVRRLLLNNDCIECKNIASADYIFVNTCSFLKTKSDYFLSFIKKIHDFSNPWQKIVVIGCLGGTNQNELATIDNDMIIFKRDLLEIKNYFNFQILPESKTTSVCFKLSPFQEVLYAFNKYLLHSKHIDYRLKRNDVCYIQISVGCQGKCTYCSEKFVTKLKSRPIPEITEAIQDGIDRGYTLFGLSTDDASAYGKDIATSLDELLKRLSQFDEDIYFTIPEFNPQGLTDSVIETLSDKKFLYITIPIQSGSQRILDKMKRPYQINTIVEKIKLIKKLNKNIMINTHIIVGFPGETKKDFEETKKILGLGLFDRVKVFVYSERPKTEAANFKNKVKPEIKERRRDEVLKIMRIINFKKLSLTNLILNLEQIKE